MPLPFLNVDDLLKPVGEIELFGKRHPVMPIDGGGYETMLSLDAASAGDADAQADALAKLFDTAGRCVPTLTPDQVKRLSSEQAGAIVGFSMKHVRAVSGEIEAEAAEQAGKAGRTPKRGGRRPH